MSIEEIRERYTEPGEWVEFGNEDTWIPAQVRADIATLLKELALRDEQVAAAVYDRERSREWAAKLSEKAYTGHGKLTTALDATTAERDAAQARVRELEGAPQYGTAFWQEADGWRCGECGRVMYLRQGSPVSEGIYYCPCCGKTVDGQCSNITAEVLGAPPRTEDDV